jgi:hypothetical protein
MGDAGEAFGGGIFNGGLMMSLVKCRLLENVASIASPSVQASAGGMYNAVGARAILDGCLLQSNTAGGVGLLQATSYSYDDDRRAAYAASKAAHLFTAGRMDLTGTTVVEESSFTPIGYTAQRWIVVGGGTLYLHSSNFSAGTDSAVTDSDTGRWLLASVTPEAEILVRQCAVRNLKLQSTAKVGVVNSEFEPPLNSSVFPTLQPGQCGSVVANVQMCDPRAWCELRQTAGGSLSGGVQCACIGAGVHEKPGVLTNGQQCEQDTIISMLMQSQAVSITLPKPSNGSADLRIVVQATGESRMVAEYSARMVRRSEAMRGTVQQNSTRSWSRLDEPRLSFDGHHVVWTALPPANDSNIELDPLTERYAVTKEYAFQLGVDCLGLEACIADGDTVETEFEVTSGLGGSGVESVVRITTLVQSLISCDHSKSWIDFDLESVSTSTAIRVHLEAYDVDMLPISYSRVPVEFRFGTRLLPQRWDRGSNEYIAEVSADATGLAGRYELVVTALNGWSNKGQRADGCVLLRRSIEVTASQPQAILAGSLAGVMVLTLGMLGYLMYRKKEKLKELMLSFLAFEGLLAMELCFEAWVWLSATTLTSDSCEM